MPATDKVKVFVENNMSKVVSICATNYPGDEGMTIPLIVPPNGRVQLPVVESAGYWLLPDGRKISTQFYLNPAGVPVQKACQWDGVNTGNWAPMNIGAALADGNLAYLGLFGNWPTQKKEILDYKVELQGQMSMPCKYENGMVCSGQDYRNCVSSRVQMGGCTVSLRVGQSMTYVLSN
jgi:hypothetical protein